MVLQSNKKDELLPWKAIALMLQLWTTRETSTSKRTDSLCSPDNKCRSVLINNKNVIIEIETKFFAKVEIKNII